MGTNKKEWCSLNITEGAYGLSNDANINATLELAENRFSGYFSVNMRSEFKSVFGRTPPHSVEVWIDTLAVTNDRDIKAIFQEVSLIS